jgi:hypothetical protein
LLISPKQQQTNPLQNRAMITQQLDYQQTIKNKNFGYRQNWKAYTGSKSQEKMIKYQLRGTRGL